MNFLAHVALAGPDPQWQLGGLMADFTRPDGEGGLPSGVKLGIRLHRDLDRFTDAHPVVREGRRRCREGYRRTSGILVDVFFDHFLARDWALLHPGGSLAAFTGALYTRLEGDWEALPEGMRPAVRRMIQEDWLTGYRDADFIPPIIDRIARRLSRPDLLKGGGAELQAHYEAWEADFRAFYPEVRAHAEAWRRAAGG